MRLRRYIGLCSLMLANNTRPIAPFIPILILYYGLLFGYILWQENDRHRSVSALLGIVNYLLDPSQGRPVNLDTYALIRASFYLEGYRSRLVVNEAEDYPGSEFLYVTDLIGREDSELQRILLLFNKFHEFRQLRTISDPMRSIIIYEFPEFVEFLTRARARGCTFNEPTNKFIDEANEICQKNKANSQSRENRIIQIAKEKNLVKETPPKEKVKIMRTKQKKYT